MLVVLGGGGWTGVDAEHLSFLVTCIDDLPLANYSMI